MFATADNLKQLAKCTVLYINSTFKTCPKVYTQLFTVQALYVATIVVPLIYVKYYLTNHVILISLFIVI